VSDPRNSSSAKPAAIFRDRTLPSALDALSGSGVADLAFRILEDDGVKTGGVFGLVVEPKAGVDLGVHDFSCLGFRNGVVHLVDEQEARVWTGKTNFSSS
jgi:hypothetical protein